MTTWAKSLPTYAGWAVDAAVTYRITEVSPERRRITEDDGAFRIVERFNASWATEIAVRSPWTPA